MSDSDKIVQAGSGFIHPHKDLGEAIAPARKPPEDAKEDFLARWTNPFGIKPEDMQACGKYLVLHQKVVRELESGIIVAESTKKHEKVQWIFCEVVSVGPQVTEKCPDGSPIEPGDYVTYAQGVGFAGPGQRQFLDYKIVEERNILAVVKASVVRQRMAETLAKVEAMEKRAALGDPNAPPG